MSGARRPRSSARVPSPRRSHGSPRRRITEIIEAAARVFEKRGIHGATTQHIADELREYLAERVPKWWLPERIEFIDAIPKTAVGKILRKELRAEEIKKAKKEK